MSWLAPALLLGGSYAFLWLSISRQDEADEAEHDWPAHTVLIADLESQSAAYAVVAAVLFSLAFWSALLALL